jgi:hypothetical protein
MTRKTLDSDDALRFFARLKQDGNFHDRLSLNEDAIKAFVAAWNKAADDIGEAVSLMRCFAEAEPKPISIAPAEFTAPDRTGRLDTLDKYRTAPQRFAFELGLWHIGLAAGQIPEDGAAKHLTDSIIAQLGKPGIDEPRMRGLLQLIRPYATPKP